MKKIFLGILSVYCVMNSAQLSAKIDLLDINRDLLSAVALSLQKVSNISSSVLAMCAHNYFVNKKSGSLFEMKSPHLLACLTGGWVGDCINNALQKHQLPSVIKVALNHSFATSWLLYNCIVNRGSVLRDPATLIVGGYLVMNLIDRKYYSCKPWVFDKN